MAELELLQPELEGELNEALVWGLNVQEGLWGQSEQAEVGGELRGREYCVLMGQILLVLGKKLSMEQRAHHILHRGEPTIRRQGVFQKEPN